METREHHPDGPSKIGRRVLCPASGEKEKEALNLGIGQETSEAADEGINLHRYLDPMIPIEDLEDEQKFQVQKARSYIAEKTRDAIKVTYEEKVYLYFGTKLILWGYLDVKAWYPDHLIIIDLKFGRATLFPAITEFQQRCYVAGGLSGETFEEGCKNPWAEVYVYQPREDIEHRGVYQGASQLIEEINQVLEYSRNHPEEFRPSVEACKYCSARSICPSFKGEIESQLPARIDPQEITTAKDWDLALQLAEKVALWDEWAKKVRSQAKALIQAGALELDGWEIREREVRKITDLSKAYEAVSDLLTQQEFLNSCDISITEIEKIFTQKLKEKDKTPLVRGRTVFNLKLETAGCLNTSAYSYIRRRNHE
jgi:hypothetical protein